MLDGVWSCDESGTNIRQCMYEDGCEIVMSYQLTPRYITDFHNEVMQYLY